MRDGSESQNRYEAVEENNDGRTMLLLVAGAVLICGVFLTAGYTAVTLIFDDGSNSDAAGSNEPIALVESAASSNQSAIQPVNQPESTEITQAIAGEARSAANTETTVAQAAASEPEKPEIK